jgi:hypothetical protein
MLLFSILGYYKLFHLKLLLSIINCFTLNYFWQSKIIVLYGYWYLFYYWLLVHISGYSINGYWWLFYYWPLVVIILVAIDGYFINDYWWLLYC